MNIYLFQTYDGSLPILLRTEFIFVALISMENVLAATEEILATAHFKDSDEQDKVFINLESFIIKMSLGAIQIIRGTFLSLF
jgi:hypothetical protein